MICLGFPESDLIWCDHDDPPIDGYDAIKSPLKFNRVRHLIHERRLIRMGGAKPFNLWD